MTTVTLDAAPALSLRALPDDELAAAWQAADVDDPAVFAAFTAEFDQRTAAERMSRAREALAVIRAEAECAVHAQYLAASGACRGRLLSREGAAAGITERDLWRMPARDLQRFASEELSDYFAFTQPRITVAAYVRQRAAEARAERNWHLDRNGGNDHDHDDDGPGLAQHDPGPLRHLAPAGETPQARTGGPVLRGGRSGTEEEGSQGDSAAGRPRGPVQHGRADGTGGDMGLIYDGFRIAQSAARDHAQAREQAAEDRQAAQRAAQAAALDAEVHGPGRIVPGECEDGTPDDYAPGDLRFVLDETAEFIGRHVAAAAAQVTAMTLYAAATHGIKAFPAFGRMLFTSEQEASGKTVAMMVTATLSANPLDASGTSYALTSALAAASNTPEQPPPTLFYDEISSLFGRSGLAASRNPVADILRKGYKSSATSQWSVNRVNEKFSIYSPFLLTGLRVAVPRDIRSRCIPVIMKAATPRAYFDAREAEPEAEALSACLGQAVGQRLAGIAAFRARGIHPRLRDRHLEVWEPLFAVAYVIGGQEWLNRCLAAFRELSLAEADQVALTPKQQTIRDVAEAAASSDRKTVLEGGTEFIGGLVLVDELRRLGVPRYQGRSEAGLALLISDALPVNTVQLRVNGERVRGYYVADIAAAWDRMRPDEPEDAEIPGEVNPFEVTGEDDDYVYAGQHDVTFGTAEMAGAQ